MTATELRTISNILGTLSDYALKLIEDNPEQVAELAANERLVRKYNLPKGTKISSY